MSRPDREPLIRGLHDAPDTNDEGYLDGEMAPRDHIPPSPGSICARVSFVVPTPAARDAPIGASESSDASHTPAFAPKALRRGLAVALAEAETERAPQRERVSV
jgi:hypothetical protein